MISYKNTLNLPETEFPMRGNLAKRELDILQRWYEHDLYGIIRKSKKGKKTFVLHDGPPYANGRIHIGHSVNKILKDIIIKSKGLIGYDSPYIPGWDCHGLPIELKAEQVIGKPGEKVSAKEFRAACRHYAAEQIAKQKKDFIRLGILGDWANAYLTMDFTTEANTIRVLSKIIANGHLYKGAKPVHWCINCRSALAETEVEYYNYISPSIDVAFQATNSCHVATKFNINDFTGPVFLVIWTTTPWTLPANRAIALHPEFEYHIIEVNGHGLIIAANLVKSFMQRLGFSYWTVLGSAKGCMLELLWFKHPFMELHVPTILSQHVTLDVGTGAVHTAPGHGPEDYIISSKYNLEVTNLVDIDGYYLPGILSALDGLQVFDANEVIINLLRNIGGALLHAEEMQHNYPHCWRHKTPLIFRTTPQWFISMNQGGLCKQSITEIQYVQWIPSWGKTRIKNMIINRSDWCISRQRTWGVPITLFVHNGTGTLHPRTIALMEEVAKLVEKDGIQAWWDLDLTDILGDDAANYSKVTDTLDVWFDSGSTYFSVVAIRPEFAGKIPDMYLEGSDQHRGWFMSSLLISTAINGKAPYRKVLTHGFAVDDHGHKMSKSVGNVISPQQIVNKFGADILRLWVASTDYTSEMVISGTILKSLVDVYRRIRNTARFILANLNDFDPVQHSVHPEQMVMLDRWAVGRSQAAQKEIIAAYDSYNFHNVAHCMIKFCSVEMGSFYLNIIKDRQYTTKADSIARRSCQTALYHIIEALVRWMAPIMSFTADEIWVLMPGKRAQYVFTEEWYDGLFCLDASQPMNDTYCDTLLQVRNEVNKVIEQARYNKLIYSSLEAHVTLYAEPTLATQLRKLDNELYFLMLTSSVKVFDYVDACKYAYQSKSINGLKITLEKAKGEKCKRCWHYEEDIGQNAEYPDICGRCIMNLTGPGEERKFI